MRMNAGPIVTRLEETRLFAQGRVLVAAKFYRLVDALQADADFRARLIAAFEATRAVRQPSQHIEEQIYEGFFEDADHLLMDAFHAAPWEERLPFVESFQDTRLRELGIRLIYC